MRGDQPDELIVDGSGDCKPRLKLPFTFNVPASAFVAGPNTMTITVVSGSGRSGSGGSGFLSAGYAYDAVDMY